MSNPAANKRKGADWEITLMKGLREEGLHVERLRLSGNEDEGDLYIWFPFTGPDGGRATYLVIEAKAGAMHPAEFVREARAERTNFAKHRQLAEHEDVRSIVIVKARGKSWKDAYVLTTVRDFFELED